MTSKNMDIAKRLAVGLCITIGLSAGGWIAGHADEARFQNGSALSGKLSRVTGEIIEFREYPSLWGRRHFLNRLQLGSRLDRIETLDGSRYLGEIFYMDKFEIDIRTETGTTRVDRLRIRDIQLGLPPATAGGSPAEPASTGSLHPVSNISAPASGNHPAVLAPADLPAKGSAPLNH